MGGGELEMVVRKLPADGEGDDGGAVAGSEIFSSLFQGPGVALGKLLIAGMQKKLRQRADRVEDVYKRQESLY